MFLLLLLGFFFFTQTILNSHFLSLIGETLFNIPLTHYILRSDFFRDYLVKCRSVVSWFLRLDLGPNANVHTQKF